MEALTGEALDEVIDAVMKSITYEEKINMVSMNDDPEDRDGVGYMTKERWEELAKQMTDIGMLKSMPDVTKAYTVQFFTK